MQKRLKELRCHVKILQRHSSQINRVKEKQRSIRQDHKQLSTAQTVAECRFVQEAAAELYLALINACKAHHEHILHFRLETRHSVSTARPTVRFHMAFVQSVLDSNTNPIWVAIESVFGDPTVILGKSGIENLEYSVKAVRSHLKRTAESAVQHTQSKKLKPHVTKSVYFADESICSSKSYEASHRSPKSSLKKAIFSSSWGDSPSEVPDNSAISGNENTKRNSDDVSRCLVKSSMSTPYTSKKPQTSMLDGLLPDFCQESDLCKHIKQWSTTSCRTTDACIGYLRRERECSHRVLVTPPVSNRSKKAISLAQIISSDLNKPQSGRFLYIDIIRLAKHLASAILLFHATPILSERWQSEDIIFYDATSTLKRSRPSLTDPHLTVRVTSSQALGRRQVRGQAQREGLSFDTRIRNPYTYRLGVILLELACQAPLCKLIEEEDLISGPKDPKTEFEATLSISETVSTDMGYPFQRIVQKCINCDFGNGNDLGDPSLQSAFYKDIVCELENLENRLNRLQLGE